jgi:hypothetical protein
MASPCIGHPALVHFGSLFFGGIAKYAAVLLGQQLILLFQGTDPESRVERKELRLFFLFRHDWAGAACFLFFFVFFFGVRGAHNHKHN